MSTRAATRVVALLPHFMAVLAFVAGLGAAGVQAASVLPRDLNTIVDRAATAFHGRCLASWSELDPVSGETVTFTRFQVTEALKGNPDPVHTIKQVGGQVGDNVKRVFGTPSFTPGEEYVVFLYGVSSLGFSSPVALSQGSFRVHAGPAGPTVGNGRDIRDLLPTTPSADMPASVRSRMQLPRGRLEHMDLGEFKELVRRRTGP